MKNSVSVRIHLEAKNKLILLSKQAKKSQTDYISRAFEFIYNSGLNIYKKTEVNIPDAVKNLERRIIGFMKKREADFFVPMNKKVVALTQSQSKLLTALEAMDVVKYASDTFEKNAPFDTPEREPSPTEDLEASNLALEFETYKKQSEAEKQQMQLHLAKAKKQADIFKNELEFLMGSISKGGALSKGKFMHNIHQIDWRRIRKLLDDN